MPQALLEVHPTMTAAVPRFFEKIYANIFEKGHHETGLKRKIFDWALRVAQESVPWRAYGQAGFSARTEVRNGRSRTGSSIRRFAQGWAGSVRTFCSGGAPLAPELAEFFWSVERAGVSGIRTDGDFAGGFGESCRRRTRWAPWGARFRMCEVRIAEDGEILVQGRA